MENATDALLIAFAIIIFVVALAVSFTSLNKAKTTADIVLFFSDRENFQIPLKNDADNYIDGGRTVGDDVVISTIARCIKEKFSVKIIEDTITYKFEYDVQTKQEIEAEINRFINNHRGKKYRETYVEATTSGTTYFGDDDSQIEENVGKKIYITFKKI